MESGSIPAVGKLPDILTSRSGAPVVTSSDWRRRRREMREILCREEYGFLPPPVQPEAEILRREECPAPGIAATEEIRIRLSLPRGRFSFPVFCALPADANCPAFVYIGFRRGGSDPLLPWEAICRRGVGVFAFDYRDITTDDGGFANGLAGLLGADEASDAPGKLAVWAWAAMRVMDYVGMRREVDAQNICVIGHSRLGKAALLAGAFDERFACVAANDSGCGGAALARAKRGETVGEIWSKFPYWFCREFGKYAGKEESMPFDQHFLLALTAPRRVYVSSAAEDPWADPLSQYLCCAAADKAYRFLRRPGFLHEKKPPVTGDVFQQGSIAYHLRPGAHDLTPYDWRQFIRFFTRCAAGQGTAEGSDRHGGNL